LKCWRILPITEVRRPKSRPRPVPVFFASVSISKAYETGYYFAQTDEVAEFHTVVKHYNLK
jgi:hypothetical protein